MGSFYILRAEIDQNQLPLTCWSLPLKVASLQLTPEFPSTYIRKILPVPLLSRWGDRFLVLPTRPLNLLF